MSFLSKLFGGGGKAEPRAAAPETYNGYRITPTPQSAPGGYRVSATIELDLDGETKTHHLIRADTIASLDEATAFSVQKAKQVIDEQGAALFD